MAKLSPDEVREKHARRLKAAIDDMRTGIERVDKSPTAAAAEKAEKMKQRLVEAIDTGKWQANLRAVSLEEWKAKFLQKGLPRVAQGIDAAGDKVRKFYEQLLPHIDQQVAEVKKMPDLTLEDSIARMTAFIRGMSKFRFKKGE